MFYGQDRVTIIEEEDTIFFKEILENLSTTPEKKILIKKKNSKTITGVITLSDIFKLISY